MLIEPQTRIKIYSGIPLDNTYENTLYFSSLSAQNNYFHGTNSLRKYELTNFTYNRQNGSSLKVQIKADLLFDCNYLAYQNTAFGNKWFYAFITSVNYISNDVSEIVFENDVMQTWYFDYTLKDSFVEREHSATDNVGDNLIEEGLETGEYVINRTETTNHTECEIVLMTNTYYEDVTPPDTPSSAPHSYLWWQTPCERQSGIVQGAHYYRYNNTASGLDRLNEDLRVFSEQGKIDQILGLFLLPSYFITSGNAPNSVTEMFTKPFGTFEGYTPRNNKLYTYPYNFLYVTNLQGNSATYPYEYFDDNLTYSFEIWGTALANAEVTIFPKNYKGSNGINKDEMLSLSNFPQCSYNVDTYKAWLAQNSGNIAASVVSTAVTSGISHYLNVNGGKGFKNKYYGGKMTKGYKNYIEHNVNDVVNSGTQILDLLGTLREHAIQPTQTRGCQNSSLLACANMLDFVFYNKRIRGEFARIIDNYFTMYGYATKRVKVPNTHVRTRWTYTKTVGCNIVGRCPTDDIALIKSIYDNGITFWVNPSEVGNYSLSNSTL